MKRSRDRARDERPAFPRTEIRGLRVRLSQSFPHDAHSARCKQAMKHAAAHRDGEACIGNDAATSVRCVPTKMFQRFVVFAEEAWPRRHANERCGAGLQSSDEVAKKGDVVLDVLENIEQQEQIEAAARRFSRCDDASVAERDDVFITVKTIPTCDVRLNRQHRFELLREPRVTCTDIEDTPSTIERPGFAQHIEEEARARLLPGVPYVEIRSFDEVHGRSYHTAS